MPTCVSGSHAERSQEIARSGNGQRHECSSGKLELMPRYEKAPMLMSFRPPFVPAALGGRSAKPKHTIEQDRCQSPEDLTVRMRSKRCQVVAVCLREKHTVTNRDAKCVCRRLYEAAWAARLILTTSRQLKMIASTRRGVVQRLIQSVVSYNIRRFSWPVRSHARASALPHANPRPP